MQVSRSRGASTIVVTAILSVFVCGLAAAQSQTRESAKTGAGWGALAGLVFGGRLSDVIEGAVVGGAAGAVVGTSKAQEAAAVEQTQIARAGEIREQERAAYEQEAQRRAMEQADYERRLNMERQQLAAHQTTAPQPAQSSTGPDDALLIRAFGEDTVTGWYALRDCKHNYALIAASAGENATAASHQLAAVWLRAITALDQNRSNSANAALQYLIDIDPEITTLPDAQEAAQDLLAELRIARRDAGVSCRA
jgi:hypothetical protein